MEHRKELLQKLAEGTLSPEEMEMLEQAIASGELPLEEIEAYQDLFSYLDLADEISPSPEMDQRFHTMLDQVEVVRTIGWGHFTWWSAPWRMAFTFGLALLTFWGGMQYRGGQEIAPPPVPQEHMLTSLLTTEDVNEKIHLVSSSKGPAKADQKIIEVLLFTLNKDESNNVRLACIDVLMNYSYLPAVRQGLVNAISHQDSPIVLTNLAEAIEASGKKIDKEDFHARINQNLPAPVKKSLEVVLTQL